MLLIRNFPKPSTPTGENSVGTTSFKSILFTRFNVPIANYRQRLDDEGTDFSVWLKAKRDAFMEFCLPSVISQSRKDFIWMVGFGERTPEVEEILEACAQHEFIKPVFLTSGGERLVEAIRTESSRDPSVDHVLSVRLDCDDALNVHFFDNLHSYVQSILDQASKRPSEKPIAINFPFGAKLIGDQWCASDWPKSPFLGLLESRRLGLKTVFSCPHGKIEQIASLRNLHTLQPMWLQVLGKENVMNRLGIRERPLSPVTSDLLDLFGIGKISLHSD